MSDGDMPDAQSPDLVASHYLSSGADHERAGHWRAAASDYREAIGQQATDPRINYFANNNLGYVLIQLGDYEQAATFCRTAIFIEPRRYNAHKNLGLALQGQGFWREAAWCFVEATRLSPGNARAWQHLEHLLETRPNVLEQDPELSAGVTRIHTLLIEHDLIQPPISPSPMYRPMDVPCEQ